ncbi:MAG: zf-TFIIB domain-containing protein [Armatimonadetes bacterium]|nr:zf-TFIIB domain-containing protein [Armatimonadota bacterium]
MELDDYISLQQAAGTVDSTGSFTVLASQARDKLARFLLAEDSQALLKLVQGCVGWGGREIWVSCDGRELTLYCSISGARELPPRVANRLETIFLGMEDSPERDILLGLCHFLCGDPESVGLSSWQWGRLQDWTTLAGQTPSHVRRHPEGLEFGLGIHVAVADCSLPKERWQGSVFFCPLPIHFQDSLMGGRGEAPFVMPRAMLEYYRLGRDSSHGCIAPRWRGRALHNLGVDLGWTRCENQKEVPIAQIRCIGESAADPATFEATLGGGVLETLRHAVQGFTMSELRLPYSTGCLYLDRKRSPERQKTVIFPVKRGVTLQALQVELPCPPAVLCLPCDDVATDLSTFQVQEQARLDVVHRALELLKEGLEICQQNRDSLPVDLDWREPRSLLAAGALVFLTVVSGGLTGLIPLIWPGALIAAWLGRSLEERLSGPKRKAELIAALHEDIAELSNRLDCLTAAPPEPDRCPACQTPMSAVDYEAMHIRGCEACGGLWLTRPEAEALIERPELPDRVLYSSAHQPGRSRLPEGSRLCTDCRTLLESDRQQDVVLDICPTCRGVFVEIGELQALRGRSSG